MPIGRATFVYLASLGAHGLLALGVFTLEGKPRPHAATSVAFTSPPKPKSEPKPPKAPDVAPKSDAPQRVTEKKLPQARVQNAPIPAPASEPPAPAAPGIPDFGVSLAGGGGSGPALGGLGGAGGGNGVGNGQGNGVETTHRVLAPASKADTCDEPQKKPRPLSVPQPAYTDDARAAGISGRVRVEITVDDRGHVSRVRVLEGLGHGLDEAALAAARAATFEAATRCGKPVHATFTVAMRFSL